MRPPAAIHADPTRSPRRRGAFPDCPLDGGAGVAGTLVTMPMASPASKPPDKFAVDKATSGEVTFLALKGTLNEAFEGRKIAESVRTTKLVVSLRQVRRFASWGMTEWMDFLRINAERDLYLVECSTYAMSQINLVTGLLGHGKLVSFYASYRCGSCSEESERLFVIPRDRALIRELPGSFQECPACNGRARLEEYPAAFFEAIASRPAFDIDDDVLAYLRSQLGYDLAPDLTRFRAYRRARDGYTYLRLSGSMALLPSEVLAGASEGTTVVDLEGIVFDPAEVAPWRSYVRAALAGVKSLQLLHCPPGFLEHAVALEDLRDKLKVRTFALSYDCLRCNRAVAHTIDVAENLEQLVAGTAPAAQCPSCRSLLVAALTPEQVAHLRALPARDRDPALDKFLARARSEPAEKLENCLTAAPRKPDQARRGTGRGLYVVLALSILLVGGLGAVALMLWNQRGDAGPAVSEAPPAVAAPTPAPAPAFTRPDWIVTDQPASAYCHELINRVMCIGVSSYSATRDAAVAEANDAALEELVGVIGLRIADPFFRDNVLAGYSAVRSKAISALQAAEIDRTSEGYRAAIEVVRKARKRVAELLRDSGGPAVPIQRTDWHWEEYAGEKGKSNETMVFIRYDVTLDAMKALVERYSTTASSTSTSTTAMTAFPAMAWQDADLPGGALLTKVGRTLSTAGLAPLQVVTAVGEQRVGDAPGFVQRLDEAARARGKLELTVKSAGAAERVIDIRQ